MKISFLPAGDHTTASTRIRVISLHNALCKLGASSHIGWVPNSDVLIVQKRVNPEILNIAENFRRQGRLVLYDCDDLGSALTDWTPQPLVQAMVKIANTVTTNTEAFRTALIETMGARRVDIIPDIVDYFLQEPCEFSEPDTDSECIRILWFGNRGNLHLVLKYAEAFKDTPLCTPIICTDEICRQEVLDTKIFKFQKWDLHTFKELLRSCHLTFLPHDGSKYDRAKSNNRMITSIAWGIPAIVSRTQEYGKLAKLAGITDSVVDGPNCLRRVINHFRPCDRRRQHVKSAQQVVWEHHAPHVVASKMLCLLEQLDADFRPHEFVPCPA